MTIVNTTTGEITEALDEAAAKRLTERIRLIAENVAEQMDKLAALIDEARTGSAWLAMGYRSWTAYVAAEFSRVLPRLDREPRQEFVRELSARGMSTRAIAPVVGASTATVARDISGVSSETPTQTSASTADAEPKVAPVEDQPRAGQSADVNATAGPGGAGRERRSPVTGLDGKTYTPPAPRPKATEQDLGEFLNSDQTIQDAKYLKELLGVLNRVRLSEFDAQRVGRIADDTTAFAIDSFAEVVADWHRRFTHQRSGLRVIDGGSR